MSNKQNDVINEHIMEGNNMNAHTPCDCNYCAETLRRVLIHEELVEMLEQALKMIPETDDEDETTAITMLEQTLAKAKGA